MISRRFDLRVEQWIITSSLNVITEKLRKSVRYVIHNTTKIVHRTSGIEFLTNEIEGNKIGYSCTGGLR